ncbi:MAG: polysaccharide biosynthesis C-terminal domain-containing protein [Flavobacteriales bacterium]|nr:polysaccharide biosynthesis C-terminal domain-containing protein [Flavobacteriales bacterium]
MIRNRELLALQVFNALRFGTAILISIVFAKVATAGEINLYESLLLLGTTFTFFYASAINHTLVPAARSAEKADRKAYYSSAFLLLQVGSILSFLALLAYARIYSGGTESELVPVYALFMLFNVPALLAENILLIENRHQQLVWYGIISFSLQFAVLCGPLLYGMFEVGLTLLVLVGFLKLLYTWYLMQIHGGFALNKVITGKLFRLSRPVMGSLFVSNGYIYLSAFLVKFRSTEELFNLFRYGAREFPLFMILANSFSTVQSGYLAAHIHKRDEALRIVRSSVLRLLHQLFPIAIILALSSAWLFRFAFNPDLAPAYTIFNILLLLLLSRVLFPQSILLALGRTRSMFHASIVEFGIGLILSYWWLDVYGIEGVAWAMVIAHLADKLVLIYAAKKQGILPVQYIPVLAYLIYAMGLLAAVLLA